MTFCLGIKTDTGLVALADSRVVRGSERLNKGKLEVIWYGGHPIFVMTSGLRSVRDKTMIYLKEDIGGREKPLEKLYQVANAFGSHLRTVAREDGESLVKAGLGFNTHAIIGGRLSGDTEPGLFYVYPAGNWIEANRDSPYFIIGRSAYGKPILDRLLRHDMNLATAINLGFLAFDATHTSVTDVDYPLDILTCQDGHGLTQRSYMHHDMHEISEWWQRCLADALGQMPVGWADDLLRLESITDPRK